MCNTQDPCKVDSKEPQPPPRLIYHYREINDKLFDTLINRQIWVSNPAQFNDPFDVRLPAFNTMQQEDIDAFTEYHCRLISPSACAKARAEAAKGRLYKEAQLAEHQKRRSGGVGVACFSEVPNDILMWSHYADKHRGVLLCFDTHHPPFDNIQRVIYSPDYPKLTPWDLVNPETFDRAYRELILYKSCDWAYEREWRLFIAGNFKHDMDRSRAIPFEPKALKRIIFGCRTTDSKRQELVKALRNWPTKIHFYQAKDHPTKFKLCLKRLSSESEPALGSP